MKKQNGIRAVLWTVLMLAAVLTGCCADGEDACTLDPANPARFTCGGVEYITPVSYTHLDVYKRQAMN